LRSATLGRSADQQAEQLQVLSNVGGGDETGVTNLVKDLRAQIAKAGPPARLQVHLAGQLAISVDQQAKSGSTGNRVEGLSVIFILVRARVGGDGVCREGSAARSAPRPARTQTRAPSCSPRTSRPAPPTRPT
jgi:hypothetical protein